MIATVYARTAPPAARLALFLMFAGVVASAVSPAAQTAVGAAPYLDNKQRETLKGLSGIHVIVHQLDDEVERNGLTGSAIKIDAELKLRQSGIVVLPSVAAVRTIPGAPVLYIALNPQKAEKGTLYAFSIEVSLHQTVGSLVIPKTHLIGAATWNRSVAGTVGPANLKELRDAVKDIVDEFVNDFLTVNPHPLKGAK